MEIKKKMKKQELIISRVIYDDNYTVGRLFLDGHYICDTLEDRVRELPDNEAGPFYKVPGETAIPKGRYQVIVNLSPKFQRRLPLLLNVPFFEGIRIHRGNHQDHTEGCILVGENKAEGKVLNSIHWEGKVTELIDGFEGETYITIE